MRFEDVQEASSLMRHFLQPTDPYFEVQAFGYAADRRYRLARLLVTLALAQGKRYPERCFGLAASDTHCNRLFSQPAWRERPGGRRFVAGFPLGWEAAGLPVFEAESP